MPVHFTCTCSTLAGSPQAGSTSLANQSNELTIAQPLQQGILANLRRTSNGPLGCRDATSHDRSWHRGLQCEVIRSRL